MTRPTHQVTLERDADQGVWLAELAEEPRVHTFGRSIEAAMAHIRDATALWFQVEAESFDLAADIQLPARTRRLVESARRQREKARDVRDRAHELLSEAAMELVDGRGLSLRDAAEVLGVSHQRVQQLMTGRQPRATAGARVR